MQHGDGEILSARAAQAAGIPFTLSTMSICSIEDVAAAVDKPFWFQLYVMRDRGFVRALIERAIAAKCSALVLTLDLQVLGQRHADVKNGMTVPPEIRVKNVLDVMTKPAWAFSVLRGKRKNFGNLAGHERAWRASTHCRTGSPANPIRRWIGTTWTVAYLRQAGTRAYERSAVREAIPNFERALAALQHLPETRDRQLQRRSIFASIYAPHCTLSANWTRYSSTYVKHKNRR